MAATLQVPSYGEIEIPGWVTDLPSFRRWVHSGVLPDKLPVHFIQGKVWVDFHMEELFTHNQVKAALYFTLGGIVRGEKLGFFLPDGMLVTNDEAGLGTEPDGMFVSFEALSAGRVRFTAGETTGAEATELVGTPDVVIEVVSRSSEDKDTEKLMAQYHDAGVPEYWLADARGKAIRFDVFRHGVKGYTATRKQDGWVKSRVFGRSFRLTRSRGAHGFPDYTLDAR